MFSSFSVIVGFKIKYLATHSFIILLVVNWDTIMSNLLQWNSKLVLPMPLMGPLKSDPKCIVSVMKYVAALPTELYCFMGLTVLSS